MRYKELQFSIPAERLLTPAVLKQNAGRLERLCSHLDDFLADNDKLRGDMDMSVFKDMQAVSCARGERVAVLSMQNTDRQQSGPAAVVRADNTAELETGPGVSVNEQGNRQELQAAVSGYLYFDGHKLDIFSPLVLSPQMVFMYYIDLNQTGRPVYPDKKEYFAFIKKNRINIDYLLIRDFKNEQDLGRSFQIRTAAKGLVPAFGKNTSVEYDINPELKPGTIDTDGRIDYLERDFAKNVKPGDLLCTFYKGAANRDGKNIRGKIIKTKRATVQPFYAGDNVSTEEDEEKILYKAASQGIVKYDKNSVAVSETLFIFGDVDLSRGNINSDIDIFIKGNIKAGLKVKSKRSIRLAGNVENGALVEAGEEFVGRGGVLGEKTLVRAASRLSALFVEGAEVCCEGDILIERYLLNATVKSLGDILVSGKNFQNANRGAVINCRVYFQKVFRSRGMGALSSEKNYLYGGTNYKADDLIKKVSAKVADINRVLSTILRSSVLDFSSPDVMRKIKKLSGYRREKELNNLKKIKQLQQAQYDLYQVLGRMNNKREGALQKSELIITGRIYPVVYIYYQNKHYKILKETNNKKFRYNQNKEEIESLDYIV